MSLAPISKGCARVRVTYRRKPTHQPRGKTMGQLKFNIDEVSDDEYFAITEAVALVGTAMEEKSTSTLLMVRLGEEGNDAVLAGTVGPAVIEKLESLLAGLKERALQEDPADALTLHLEELPG